jgi:hypothetical protein
MRVWSFLIIAAVIAFPRHILNATDIGSPPLPPPRLTEQPLHPTPQDNALVEQSKPNSAHDQACLDRLGDALITFETVTLPLPANPECAIATPVRLKAVMSSRGPILLPDEPTLSCQFGERFGHWLRDLVAPLIAGELAVELKSVHTGPGYECRNRNRAADGKISAHASGLAIDVGSFELSNGRMLAIAPNGDEHMRATVDAIRVAACGWFTTVLGPGSDEAHTDHMHVDILQHGSSDRFRICQ